MKVTKKDPGMSFDAFAETRTQRMLKEIEEKTGRKPRAAGDTNFDQGRWAHMNGAQAPSTTANLKRQAKGEERDWIAPIPEGHYANPDAEEVWAARAATTEDILRHKRMQHRGHDNTLGESKLSATTPEKRESAVHHYMVSGHVKDSELTEADRARIQGLEPIKSAPPPPLELKKKRTGFGGFVDRFSINEMINFGKKKKDE